MNNIIKTTNKAFIKNKYKYLLESDISSDLKNIAEILSIDPNEIKNINIILYNKIKQLSQYFATKGIQINGNIIFDSLVNDMMDYILKSSLHLEKLYKGFEKYSKPIEKRPSILNKLLYLLRDNHSLYTNKQLSKLYSSLSEYEKMCDELDSYEIKDHILTSLKNNIKVNSVMSDRNYLDLLNEVIPDMIKLGFSYLIPSLKRDLGLSSSRASSNLKTGSTKAPTKAAPELPTQSSKIIPFPEL